MAWLIEKEHHTPDCYTIVKHAEIAKQLLLKRIIIISNNYNNNHNTFSISQ